MEDILASIRRILSEEETAEQPAAAAPPPAPAAPAPAPAVKEWGGGKKDEAPGAAAKEWGGGKKDEGPGAVAKEWEDKPIEAPNAVQESWQNKPPEVTNPAAEGWTPKAPEAPGGKQEEWHDKPLAAPGGREEEWHDKPVAGGAKSWGQDEGRRGRRQEEEDDGVLVLTPDMIADDDLELADSGMGRGMGGNSALAQLKRAVAQRTQSMASDRNLALGNGGITIEQLCREILDDLLRDWLNQHLPPMVEKIAKREIQKLVANSD
jgi:cell pole-organizing protein PopZ